MRPVGGSCIRCSKIGKMYTSQHGNMCIDCDKEQKFYGKLFIY